jgi:ubiquinone/menaquinone biosynthesis C-methylase UbiE
MQKDRESVNYIDVTETPGVKGSREQIARLYTRYRFASEFCKNKDVLEVACGAGLGVGYLASSARRVVAGDIDKKNLEIARRTYQDRKNIEIRSLDANSLPFGDKSFDVVILYEAIYYLNHPEKCVNEARRVLREGGIFIICTVNKDWSDFNPSPYSHRYFSAPELVEFLRDNGFEAELFGDSPVNSGSGKNKILSIIKRAAVRLRLIPKTMKGKERLKRLFFGELNPLPSEITDGMAEYVRPVSVRHDTRNTQYKVLFAVSHVL